MKNRSARAWTGGRNLHLKNTNTPHLLAESVREMKEVET